MRARAHLWRREIPDELTDILWQPASPPTTDNVARLFPEGDVRTHIDRERRERRRHPGLRRHKLQAFIAQHGYLFCEECGMKPHERYPNDAADVRLVSKSSTTKSAWPTWRKGMKRRVMTSSAYVPAAIE